MLPDRDPEVIRRLVAIPHSPGLVALGSRAAFPAIDRRFLNLDVLYSGRPAGPRETGTTRLPPFDGPTTASPGAGSRPSSLPYKAGPPTPHISAEQRAARLLASEDREMMTRHPQIVVTGGTTPDALPSTTQVHHHDFPEIWAEGGSLREATIHLANHLSRAIESASSFRRRDPLTQALAAVEAFLDDLCLSPEDPAEVARKR